jgi:uncharacterized protein
MSHSGSADRHPFISLIILLGLILIGAVIFTIIGAVIGGVVYGMPDLLKFFAGDLGANLELTKIVQIAASTGMFIIPGLFFARIESRNWLDYLKLKTTLPVLFILTILLMFISVPLLELSVEINTSMKLPAFLAEIEEWMRRQEDQMAEVTKQLLTMKTFGALLVNLLMLAVIPAIGEEFIFRGCLQRLFKEITGNHHIAIWLTAIIFSAIHMQFYGFIPRMLLGAMFGYLLVWSNSLWLPILAHFVNNATAVITAYVYQQQGKSLDQLNDPQMGSWPAYLMSLFGTAVILWYFYQKAKTPQPVINNTDGARLD